MLQSTIVVPIVRDSSIKYRFMMTPLNATHAVTPAFAPFMFLKTGVHEKYTDHISNAVIGLFSVHAYGNHNGFSLNIWADPQAGSYKLHIQTDILGTLGSIILRYATALVALFYASMLMVFSSSQTVLGTHFPTSNLLSIPAIICTLFTSSAYSVALHYLPIPHLISNLFLGKHDLVLLPLFLVLALTAFGILNSWLWLLSFLIGISSRYIGRRIVFVTSRRIRIFVSVLAFLLSALIDQQLVLLVLTCYCALVAIATNKVDYFNPEAGPYQFEYHAAERCSSDPISYASHPRFKEWRSLLFKGAPV